MRKSIIGPSLFSAALCLASCEAAQTGDTAPASTPAVGQEVHGAETVEMSATSPFAAQSFGAFNDPWALAFEPGTGVIFITEKPGTMKFVDPRAGRLGTVTGLPDVVHERQGGLGDFAFAPDYESSREVYLSWAQQADGDNTVAAVGRATLVCEEVDTCRLDGLREIWRQNRSSSRKGHYSHKLAFSPDGQYLFVSSGDRMEADPAQDMANNLGAIVRLGLDGKAAEGNPFATYDCTCEEIWSFGHRNVLGLAFDPAGNLWEIEHGPKGGDELNLVRQGANYGWPVRSNGVNYNDSNIPDHTADDGFAKPALGWTPVIAPGDMIFYTGAMFPDWQGQLLVANLKTMSISRITTNAAANSAEELSRYDFPKRLRDIAQAPDGAIWVIEDKEGGRLLRLTPAG